MRHSRARSVGLADRERETARGPGDVGGQTLDARRVDHVEPAAAGGSAVGVDRDRSVRAGSVADSGPLRDARPPGRLRRPRHDDLRAGCTKNSAEAPGDVEGEVGLAISGRGGCPGRVAGLAKRSCIDQSVDLGRVTEVPRVVARVDRDRPAREGPPACAEPASASTARATSGDPRHRGSGSSL